MNPFLIAAVNSDSIFSFRADYNRLAICTGIGRASLYSTCSVLRQ